MASEYSYYSEDDHHEKGAQKFHHMKSGMTEQNVVPKDLPAVISNIADKVKDDDAESDWSDQVREANEKSGFTKPKVLESALLQVENNRETTVEAKV